MAMSMYDTFKAMIRGRTPFRGWGGRGGGYNPYSVFWPGPDYDYNRVVVEGLWRNGTVASGIDWLSRNWLVPQLQVVRVGDDGIEEPIMRHPALDLLRRPHRYLGESAFVGTFVRDMTCYGNYWVEKVYNGLGEVVELRPWRTDMVSPLYPDDGSEYLSGWRYNVNGKMLDVAAKRVIHLRRYSDVVQDRVGWTPLHSVVREICVLNEASSYAATLLKNFGTPGMLATPKGDFTVSDDDAMAIKQKLTDTTTGEKRFEPIVLTGAYDVTKLGWTPEELGLVELPKPAQAQVLSAMGLNTDVLGLNTEHSGAYGSYAEAIRAAYVHGLIPLQRMFAEEMTWQLLVDFEDEEDVRSGRVKFSFDYSPVEELDDREQIAANRAIRLYSGGVLTLNESRDIVGYGKSDSPDADLVGVARDKVRSEMLPQDNGATQRVSEGDNLGSVKVPADGQERSMLEGERDSDALSPSRSGVNKSGVVDVGWSVVADIEALERELAAVEVEL
jgi:HK97 family phage portal protein